MSIVGCGIERLINENSIYKNISHWHIQDMALRGKQFFDAYADTIFNLNKYPIGVRRDIMKMYLAGDDISQFK